MRYPATRPCSNLWVPMRRDTPECVALLASRGPHKHSGRVACVHWCCPSSPDSYAYRSPSGGRCYVVYDRGPLNCTLGTDIDEGIAFSLSGRSTGCRPGRRCTGQHYAYHRRGLPRAPRARGGAHAQRQHQRQCGHHPAAAVHQVGPLAGSLQSWGPSSPSVCLQLLLRERGAFEEDGVHMRGQVLLQLEAE